MASYLILRHYVHFELMFHTNVTQALNQLYDNYHILKSIDVLGLGRQIIRMFTSKFLLNGSPVLIFL